MKSNKGKSLVGLLLAIIVIGVFGYFGYASIEDIKLGLDLAGGVSITYQAKEENPTQEAVSDTVYKLQQRVQSYSTEAEVYQEGKNRINVDIPGVSDANAILEELGKPGSLTFQDSEGNVLLDGNLVATAKPVISDHEGHSHYSVGLTFTEEGSQAFAKATEENIGKNIAIVYDGEVYSNPVVQSVITGGQAEISGMNTYEEAEKLASTIRIGSLKLELEELRSNVVGAKLGQEAISTSLKAGAIGFILVALFMIVIYFVPGVAATLALTLYVTLMLILLVAFEVTLTLPGIAGIILSIGMAVDANIIIFTRIKEEIGKGRDVGVAIKAGFNKALSAIIDGNITTLIAAGILFWKGSGTVKGFASTLAIGVLLSMVTALFITKFILLCFYNLGLTSEKFYGVKKDEKVYNFMGMRKICFAISIVVCLAGFVAMGVNMEKGNSALNYSLEFKGGTSTSVTFNEELSLEQISSEVQPVVASVTGDNDIQTQKVTGSNTVIVKTRTLSLQEREALNQGLADTFGVEPESIVAESISGAISKEMKQDAIIAVAIAVVFMLIYIWFRFKEIRFAGSAIIALVHDVLIVLAFYALFRWSIGSSFIACMLTIVGYSINATIVIFDRIREHVATMPKKQTYAEAVNLCITQTLSRSMNTNITAFIMIFVLYLIGVPAIRDFALPLMVGIVGGTFSSVCITGPLWCMFMQSKLNRAKAGKE